MCRSGARPGLPVALPHAVVSTTDDLNRFYRALLGGTLIGEACLDEMTRPVPVNDLAYGLGIYSVELPCGRFRGHEGAVFGAGVTTPSSRDGKRQVALARNLMKDRRLDDNRRPQAHPIDCALYAYVVRALCPAAPKSASVSHQLTRTLKFDQLSPSLVRF
ncbi:hypothetical protein ABZ499_09245 [Streptomyces sp. NPDC019990]|uniref:hypothetical protein n=1 Tax=Streptomyces sp. NPDC019990 TaxID=3154693 RepID=UPI00340B7E83